MYHFIDFLAFSTASANSSTWSANTMMRWLSFPAPSDSVIFEYFWPLFPTFMSMVYIHEPPLATWLSLPGCLP